MFTYFRSKLSINYLIESIDMEVKNCLSKHLIGTFSRCFKLMSFIEEENYRFLVELINDAKVFGKMFDVFLT